MGGGSEACQAGQGGQEGEAAAEWERANPMHYVVGKAAVVWEKNFFALNGGVSKRGCWLLIADAVEEGKSGLL